MLISTHQPAFRNASLLYRRLASLSEVQPGQMGQMLEKQGAAASSLGGIQSFQNDPLPTYLQSLLPCCCFSLVSWQKKQPQLSRAGKVGLCSAGLPFKGLFGHNGPYYSCRLRCQGEELMFHSARQESRSVLLCVLYMCFETYQIHSGAPFLFLEVEDFVQKINLFKEMKWSIKT